MKYSIGEFAEMIGITADTLRLYEKHDIIKPSRDNQNNYRYYTDLDVRDLLMSRWYRSLQISLQDTACLTKESSTDNIIEKLQEVQIDLQEEISRKTMLLNRVAEISNDINEIKPWLNKCRKEEVPGLYRLIQTDKDTLLKEDFIKDTVDTWMDLLPHTFYSFKMDKEGILFNEDCIEYNWGLAISEEDFHYFKLQPNDNIEYNPPVTCISSIILSPHSHCLTKNSYEFMTDYIKENNYSVKGDAFGRILLNKTMKDTKASYLKISIPITI